MHPELCSSGTSASTPSRVPNHRQSQHFKARGDGDPGPASTLPDFGLEMLLGGGLPEEDSQLLSSNSAPKPSVYARRGSAADGSGLFIKPQSLKVICTLMRDAVVMFKDVHYFMGDLTIDLNAGFVVILFPAVDLDLSLWICHLQALGSFGRSQMSSGSIGVSASKDQASGWGDVLTLPGEGGPTPRQHSLLTPLGRAHSQQRGGGMRSILLSPGSGGGGGSGGSETLMGGLQGTRKGFLVLTGSMTRT